MNADKWLKLVAALSLMLLIVTLIVAYQSPATGYEISIYTAIDAPIWVFVILAIFGGIIIVIHQATTRMENNSRIWLLGLTVLIFSQVVILAIPYIRGYVAFRGDNITHLGMVLDITASGNFGNYNFYPAVHVLLSSLAIITGCSEITVFNVGTAFLAPAIFFLSTYLLAMIILPEKRQRLIIIAMASLIFPAVNVTPNGWSMLFLPLLFLCYFRRSVLKYEVFLILILVLFPFLHPLSSFMVILALIVIEVVRVMLSVVAGGKSTANIRLTFEPVLIEIVVFCMWVLSFSRFQANLRAFWNQMINFASANVLGDIVSTLGKINLEGLALLLLYFKLYGVTTVLILLSLGTVFLLARRFRSQFEHGTANLFLLSCTFLFAGFLYLLYLLGFPGLSALGGDRFLRYALIFTPLFAGFCIYEILKKLEFHKLAVGAAAVLIILCVTMQVFLLYPSPFIIRPNPQITQRDISGMAWFIEEKDAGFKSIYVMSPVGRFADGIIGKTSSSQRRDLKSASQFPDHFAYTEYKTLGEQFVGDKYTVITRFDRVLYTNVWQMVGRFNDNDFDKLENDSTVDRLYSNGELEVYLIHGKNN